jgi:hypothetical protein
MRRLIRIQGSGQVDVEHLAVCVQINRLKTGLIISHEVSKAQFHA